MVKALGGVTEKTGGGFACVTGQTDLERERSEWKNVVSQRKRKKTVSNEEGGKTGRLGTGTAASDSSDSEGAMSDCSELSLTQNDAKTALVSSEKKCTLKKIINFFFF